MVKVPSDRRERLLVCIGPSPSSTGLVRVAQKMAADLKAEWFTVYVEDSRMLRLPESERSRAVYNLRLAEQLGAEAVTLRGSRIAEEVIGFARQRNITRIVVGKPRQWRWQAIFRSSPVDKLVRLSGNIDVEVIAAELGEQPELRSGVQPKGTRRPEYELGILFFIAATGLASLMYPYFELSNLIMVFLVAVMVTAIHCGRGSAILVSVLSVLTFDFCFVPPRWTFDVAETHFIFTFAVMFLVALVISHLTSLVRRQAEAARLQERQTASMHSFSRELASTRGVEEITKVAVKHISEIFACQAAALLPDKSGQVRLVEEDAAIIDKDIVKELGIAQWTFEHGQMAGWGTPNLPESPMLYVPLPAADVVLGVLALKPRDPASEYWQLPEQLRLHLLESLAKQVALALQVERLQKTALDAQVTAETERLRASLLGSVTHDFQTPLAAIMGSASSLLELKNKLDDQLALEMLTNIYEEADRLSRLITNLLNIARLESRTLTLRKELQPLEEVVGAALNRLERKLAGHPIRVSLPADLPMVPLDGALVENVFLNLLENSLKYSPSGSALSIQAVPKGDEIEIEMADNGPGFPPADLEKVFETFYRGAKDSDRKGYGLGLSICRAIVEAHGGRIWAVNRAGGGAAVKFTFPLKA